MLKSHWLGLAGASLFILQRSLAAPYADAVTAYQPGTGFVAGYTDPTVALGQPGRPDPYATPDDPFDPAWHASQIVSVGTGGFLTVRFDAPIQHHPSHPYGIDFLIFGNAGFIVTNEDYIGTLATDGSLFGASSAGSTRVWVSQDGVTFYQLNPSLAPVVDNLFPTDGAGDLQKAVSSFLRTADFAGQTLDGIRVLYAGSGGGAGFNLAWAQDTNGQPVNLSSASYVRVNVLSGHAEIDGFAAVASPEVAVMAEDFSSDPATRGWRMWGDPSLFHWNADSQRLEVTWDSSRPNSYCFRLLEVPLSQSDDFSINFDLRLSDVAGGVRAGRPGPFEIAIGLVNTANATNATFARGRVGKFPNLCEFDYFPQGSNPPPVGLIAPTVSPMVSSTNGTPATSMTFPLEMTVNDWFHVQMSYTASNQTVLTAMTRNGQPFGPIRDVSVSGYPDFRLDAVSVSSYNDSSDRYGSVLAHGELDNLVVATPALPRLTGGFSNSCWHAQFSSRSNWLYALERSSTFTNWNLVSAWTAGNGGVMDLAETNRAAAAAAFYRLRLQKE